VTIFNNFAFATVTVDTNGVAIGAYNLELQSFDSTASSPQATLKADIVIIYITEYVRYVGF
jgi:hypothetical protein